MLPQEMPGVARFARRLCGARLAEEGNSPFIATFRNFIGSSHA